MDMLPNELREHIAYIALNNGDGLSFSSTSHSLRDAISCATGAASIFGLALSIALRSIGSDDIAARMRLVHRALVKGHRAQLFIYSPTESHPLPSPLREHICDKTGITGAHILPLEHNLTVHISNPVDPDAIPFMDIKSVSLWTTDGNHWLPGYPVTSIHLNFFEHQITLHGQTQTISNIINRHELISRQCCRRMAIVVYPRLM